MSVPVFIRAGSSHCKPSTPLQIKDSQSEKEGGKQSGESYETHEEIIRENK